MLSATDVPLGSTYDLVMLDLDGVVYRGEHPVPGAAAHLGRARALGAHLAFVTNNASRTPEDVAAHLTRLDVPAVADDVVTSAQAAAHLLAEEHAPGAPIAVLGGDGLRRALLAEGLVPVEVGAPQAVALVSGFGPDVVWRDVVRAGARIRDGLTWVASNRDLTFPTSYGLGPGHGALVELLENFSRVTPAVAGKPSRHLLDETVRRVGGARPLMVGDRLDTDIAGAHHAGVDSMLVLTGVSGLEDVVAAPAGMRPSYIAADLTGLAEAHPAPDRMGDYASLGGWRARVVREQLEVSGAGAPDDWWRVVASAAWTWQDRYGSAPAVGDCRPPTPSPNPAHR